MNIKIRKLRKQDARKVSYLTRKTLKEVLNKVYSKKVIDFLYKVMSPAKLINDMKDTKFYVAVEKNKILGVCGLKGNEVKKYAVHPKYHNKGIGRKLMEHLEKAAKKRKIKKLIVYGNLHAQGFYKKMGFKRIKTIKRGSKGIQWTDVLMEKKI